MESIIKHKLALLNTDEYKREQEARLEKIKELRKKSSISSARQYMAMLNSVCGENRINSRKRIESMKNNCVDNL